MSLLEILSDRHEREELRSRIYGVVIGIVTNNQDPDGLGKVKVKFPWLVDQDESNWARVVTPMAGPGHGLSLLPNVDDEVLVAFEYGDIRSPYVLGALWNGVDKPPKQKTSDSNNNLLVIQSRSEHLIVLDDTSGSEKIEIIDKTGSNKISIDSSKKTITLQADGDIELKAANGKIVLNAKTVEITSSGAAKVEAGSSMDLKASQTMTVKGATVNIN